MGRRWAEAVIVRDKTADTVVSSFIKSWVPYGVPKEIICDNEKSFHGLMMRELAKLMGTELVAITPYHPQGNTPVESFHRHLRKHFDRIRRTGGLDLEEVLALTMYIYRTSYHTALEDTPGRWLFGVSVTMPEEREIDDLMFDTNASRIEWLQKERGQTLERMRL
ncbi:putative Pol polyprotein [Gregarina niphandrodes]|uniref:Pol polyprotein n=1 Tax=Gregarina niphandrodes TaxID=110365 RepID=A0A023AX00_GRENI|nr:putative Pol polyprotein [Gregarina niphandrodes]EZG42760.1 putative Pol polyprotein [Gregarina niphandrodes]|eukprot:XP_011133960.1 putative Pol polyprotein [Gregarina niphandrodes]